MRRQAPMLTALAIAFAVIGIGLTGLVSESTTDKPTCPNNEGAGVALDGSSDRGRYGSPEAAVRATAARELRDYDGIHQRADGRYAAQRNGQDVALFDVMQMPRGGYEVGGIVVCAQNLRPDSDQP